MSDFLPKFLDIQTFRVQNIETVLYNSTSQIF